MNLDKCKESKIYYIILFKDNHEVNNLLNTPFPDFCNQELAARSSSRNILVHPGLHERIFIFIFLKGNRQALIIKKIDYNSKK
jgi:hypothetical protein